MYGTIAKVTVKPEKAEKLIERTEQRTRAPGEVASYAFRMDSNPQEYILVAIFESREAYRANAETEEQHARYLEMRALLESDPEWHDGEIVYANSQ